MTLLSKSMALLLVLVLMFLEQCDNKVLCLFKEKILNPLQLYIIDIRILYSKLAMQLKGKLLNSVKIFEWLRVVSIFEDCRG